MKSKKASWACAALAVGTATALTLTACSSGGQSGAASGGQGGATVLTITTNAISGGKNAAEADWITNWVIPKFEEAQKARESRRNQTNTVIKEMKLRPKIDEHDYETKKGHVSRFLNGGDKVKVMIMFRGREQSRPEAGVRLLQRLAEDVGDLATVESMPRQDGRNMTMVLAPTRRKADAINEQRQRREAERVARKDKKAERSTRDQARGAESAR